MLFRSGCHQHQETKSSSKRQRMELSIASKQFSNAVLSNNDWELLLLNSRCKYKCPATCWVLAVEIATSFGCSFDRFRWGQGPHWHWYEKEKSGVRSLAAVNVKAVVVDGDLCSSAVSYLHPSWAQNSCEKQKWYMPLKRTSLMLAVFL